MSFSPLKPQLKHFLSLCEHKNVSKAAKSLGLAQPQLSKSLFALESELGFSLFQRTNRGLIITKSGQEFLSHIQDLQQHWIHANNQSANISSLFRIGAHSLIASGFLPTIIKHLQTHYPLLNIQYLERNSKEISHLVASRDLEIGIAADPTPLQGLIMTEIAREDVALWSAGKNNQKLVVNPQMAQFSKFLKKSKYTQIIEIENYHIAAKTAIELECHCLLPEPAANKNLNKIKTLDSISIKLVFSEHDRNNPIIKDMKSLF
jgi:hypothetical protein